MDCIKRKILKFYICFEENTETVYKNALRVALSIWMSLLFLIAILIIYFITNPKEMLPLSAIAISLSAMVATLMAWYNIETSKKEKGDQKKEMINREFLLFYTQSFQLHRMLTECVHYENPVLPEELSQMVIFALEKYLSIYPTFTHFHSLLTSDEARRLSEKIWGFHHDFAKLKRAVASDHSMMIKETIKSADRDLNVLVNEILKRSFDENSFSKRFDNSKREVKSQRQ